MHPVYPRMFSPLQLGPIEVPNRFFFSPHGVHLTVGPKPSTDYVHYQAARAKGGCGLIVCSMTSTDRGRHTQPSPHSEDTIPAFAALADAVHAAGAKIFAQPWYHWTTPGHWQPYSPAAPAISASTAQFGYNGRTLSTHAMSKAEIREAVAAMGRTTANLRAAGFDGVMLHASHGGMLEQFLSPYFNQRTDEYGGSLDNRLRLLMETLEACHAAAGGQMAIGMRFNCDELLPGGYGTGEASEILSRVCASGLLHFADLDVAVEPNQLHLGMPPSFSPFQVYRPYVEAVRAAAGDVPVLSVLGRVRSIADAEAAIADGACDMVGAARALIAEPNLVGNAREGRETESRQCISCNWCLAAATEGAQGCTINPVAYRERIWGDIAPAGKATKVVVVGGGPGGLEAARVAALKGHRVVLFEARTELGGGVALWAKLPDRAIIGEGIDWWRAELARLDVDVRLGVTATAQTVLAEQPGAVIVATGATYSPTGRTGVADIDIPGHDQKGFVYTPEEILLGGARLPSTPGGKVVVFDGEGLHTGLGIAEMLGAAGAEVELLNPNLNPLSVRVVASFETRFVRQRLRAAGVRITTSAHLRNIGRRQVTAYDVDDGAEWTIDDVDAVVLCTGRIPDDALEKALEGKVDQLFVIGDALAARVFATASYEGHKFARLIGEPDAPKTFGEVFFARNAPDITPLPGEALKA